MIEANRKAKIMLKARSLKQTLHRKRPFNTSRMCCVAVKCSCRVSRGSLETKRSPVQAWIPSHVTKYKLKHL